MQHHRELSFEDDDGNNISKDDSEDFGVEDTAFFRTTSGGTSDQPSGGGSDLLSPAASPTPFGTPRVWSAHSLYGEALVHSTRQLSAGNNTCSTMADDDDKVLGPQQPLFSRAEGPIYEDLLVSPSSPISETPTTPPSVARKPSLSPPPLEKNNWDLQHANTKIAAMGVNGAQIIKAWPRSTVGHRCPVAFWLSYSIWLGIFWII